MYFTAMKMKNLCILFAVIVLVDVVSAADEQISVSVNVGDSLTLHTGFIRKPGDIMKCFFKGNRIAEISRYVSKICTDEHCDERFRDRLQMNNQTGDLTITNITTEDTGLYIIHVISSNFREKNFILTVQAGVSGTDVIKKVKEGESVSLDSGATKTLNDSITWYFNGIRIAQINGHPSEACTDVQCDTGNERLRERLKLNHQTGSLTIINTRITDTGEYQREITSSSSSISFSSRKTFSVTVIDYTTNYRDDSTNFSSIFRINKAITDSGPSSGVIAGISVVVLLLLTVVTAGVYYLCRRQGQAQSCDDQENDRVNPQLHQNRVNESTPLSDGVNESSTH